ncbi:hypothetical protein KNE206_61260 [Kitasatospora sp. NE20-6]|uniref:hypothetical protein n=1 Tax=Kitasatospora sp. NE20-6 TaxID=2859066 RepID=UPI0034DCA078
MTADRWGGPRADLERGTTPTAFYLLKPDALVDAEVPRRARELLPGLEVVDERDVTLTPAQVSALWAENRSELRPIASSFLGLYLVGRTSRLVTVRGAQALAGVIGLKRRLRREYGQGAFANVVHAPSDPWENEDHAAVLEGRERPPGPGTPPRGNPPASPRVVALGPARVLREVSAVWRQAHDEGWPSLAVSAPDAPAAVWLVADDVHSIDSAVSALWDALPQLGLRAAIAIVCEAERTGRALAWAGAPEAVSLAAKALRARRLQVETAAAAATRRRGPAHGTPPPR